MSNTQLSKETKFINLTPHALNIYTDDGKNLVTTIPPEPVSARLTTMTLPVATAKYNNEVNAFVIFKTHYGDIEGLPEPEENTFYIVSTMVRDEAVRLYGRHDLLVPGKPVRDSEGIIIGCMGLSF